MDKRTIEKIKVRHWIYCWLFAASILGMAIGYGVFNLRLPQNVQDIIRNIAYGCMASTIVAWLMDISSVNEENRRIAANYDIVYIELKLYILAYITTWARMCSVAYKEDVCKEENHLWKEWYDLIKKHFWECDEARRKNLLENYFLSELKYNMSKCVDAIDKIEAQSGILTATGIYNNEIKTILIDFRLEFGEITIENYIKNGHDEFWKWMDAINSDIEMYISRWEDIKHYNLIMVPSSGWVNSKDLNKALYKLERSV